jgi:GDPmannose 4,6-dehydratase
MFFRQFVDDDLGCGSYLVGDLDAQRDWGYAGDYVEAMWLMLQQDRPDDYVIATGESHSVREVLEVAFGTLGLDWKAHVEIDPRYYRPTEVDHLLGDARKAREKLGWNFKVRFKELIEMMVRSDEADVRSSLTGRAPQISSMASRAASTIGPLASTTTGSAPWR